MLLDNPMPPGAVTDALRCTTRSRRAHEAAIEALLSTLFVVLDRILRLFGVKA